MPERRTILFLYSRLPDYFYQCAVFFVNAHSYDVVIIRHREDVNTKYVFKEDPNIRLYYKDEVDIRQLILQVGPAAIVLSGWSDKTYTSIAKKYRAQIPVVLAMDNPWYGTAKQRILTKLAPFSVHKIFNKVWVTGKSQYLYASRLGFVDKDIIKDLYSADCDKFYDGIRTAREPSLNYPRNIVYVGRMVEYKQPHLLAEVFHEIVSSTQPGWRLILAGEGPLKEIIKKKNYKQVEVTDFIIPPYLPLFYQGADIFVLPSINEHWGVSVHEAAAAGLPLLLSDSVESGSQFLIHGFNGYKFSTGNRESLKKYLTKLMVMPGDELHRMGENSIKLSKTISHETWAANLYSLLVDR